MTDLRNWPPAHVWGREDQRLTEAVTEGLREKLEREPTEAEIEDGVEQAIDDIRYDCPNGGDGPDD